MQADLLYFRRSLDSRTEQLSVVYVVSTGPDRRADPVPVIAAMPAGWRPTDFPGQLLYDADSAAEYFACAVPRSQFKYYERLSPAEARTLYPEIEDVAMMRTHQLPRPVD